MTRLYRARLARRQAVTAVAGLVRAALDENPNWGDYGDLEAAARRLAAPEPAAFTVPMGYTFPVRCHCGRTIRATVGDTTLTVSIGDDAALAKGGAV